MNRFAMAALIAAAAFPSVAAANGHATGTYMVAIPVRGLDISSPAGAAALRDRASQAAAEVCLENVRPLRSRSKVKLCRTDFMNKVERHIERASQHAQLSGPAGIRR